MQKQREYQIIERAFLATFLFFVYLGIASIVNKMDISWMLLNSFKYVDFLRIYPNYPLLAFLLFKVIPLLGTIILLTYHCYLIFKFRNDLSVYVEVVENKSFIKKFNKEIIVFIFLFLVYKYYGSLNFYYLLTLVFSILLFYIFYRNNWFEKRTNSLFYLIFVAIILRLVYLSQTGIHDTREDSLARIAQIYHWVEFGGIPGHLIWLPGQHLIVYSISSLLKVSFEASGVLFSFCSSIGLIVAGYLLFERIFDRIIGLLFAGFIVFNPYIIQFSVNQMVTVPFGFLIILGTYFAIIYHEKSQFYYLLLSVISFNVANLLRFEGWVITFLLLIVFLLQFRNLRKTIFLFIPSAFSAIFSALISLIHWGDPFYGVTASDIEVALAFQFSGLEIFEKVTSSIYFNNWIPIIFLPLTIAALIYCAFKRIWSYFALLILFLISFYTIKMFSGTLEPFWRYFTVPLVFSIPFLFYFLRIWVSNYWLVLLVFVFLPFWSIHKINYIIDGFSPLPKGFKESALHFKQKSSPNDKVILSMNPYSDDDLWISYCNRILDSTTYSNWYPGLSITEFHQPFTIQKLKNKLINEKYEWLVIDQAYALDSLFEDEEFADYYNSVQKETDTIGDIILIEINH